jgi:predicted alpha/beta superfamily hydrolase
MERPAPDSRTRVTRMKRTRSITLRGGHRYALSALVLVVVTWYTLVSIPLVHAVTRAQANALPQVVAGMLERLEKFASKHVDARNVDVWLPPDYDAKKRYPVLYMHDGQMLFDPKSTWNKQAWQIDKVATKLIADGKVRDFIVVGIWNNGKFRHAEFYPEKFLPFVPEEKRKEFVSLALNGKPLADAYLRFIVEELKPAIDARYSTVRDASGTFLMGSSMGGLISAYGLLEYPNVFGAAAALSPHWIAVYGRNDIFPDAAIAYLKNKLPAAGKLKLYMDRGTIELDEQYDQAQKKIDTLVRERGHTAPRVVSLVFEGAGHNEAAWNARLDIPLLFLLSK